MIRIIKDPYSGLGVELSFTTRSGAKYAFGPSIGLKDKLLEIELTATPPFDTHRINTAGAEESSGSGLVILEARLTLLWVSVGIEFHRIRAGSWLTNI